MASSATIAITTEDDGVVSETSLPFGSTTPLPSPHSRAAGGTEQSWCRVVCGGTGITLLALLFREPVEPPMLQQVVDGVQWAHPRLRSRLVWSQNGPMFAVSATPCVVVEVLDGQELLAELEVAAATTAIRAGAQNSLRPGEVCEANAVGVGSSLSSRRSGMGCKADVGDVLNSHRPGKGCKVGVGNAGGNSNSRQSSNGSCNSCAIAGVMDGEEGLSVELGQNSCGTGEGCKVNGGGCDYSCQSCKACEANFGNNLDSCQYGNGCNLCAEAEVMDGEEDLLAELKASCDHGGLNSCQSGKSCKVDVSDVSDSNSHQPGNGCKGNVGDSDSHQPDKGCKVDISNVGNSNLHQSGIGHKVGTEDLKLHHCGNQTIGGDGDQKSCRSSKDWLAAAATHELNICDWLEHTQDSQPVPMLVVRLYQFPPSFDSNTSRSLVILRLHTAICDRASASTILIQMLHSFHALKQGHPLPLPLEEDGDTDCLIAVEDAIPKEKSNKPFWAHGLDILGYSLGSRRHALLPFEDPNSPRRSEIIRLSLGREHTQELMQMCAKQRISLAAALSAAGLKATTMMKHLGNRGEHYAIVTLIDCRLDLDHLLTSSTVGFYHSAILNTHFCSEVMEFWGVAKKCSSAVESSLRNRKHLTDMGDMNFLMCQAMQFPHLTPSCSLRTSLMAVFEDPIVDDMAHLKEVVGVEDYLGCSSIHGVGPSIAVFHTVQDGCLLASCVYPTPLHSRSQMETFVDIMEDVLISALKL